MDWRLLRPALCSLVLAVAHAADANCRGEAPAYDLKGAQATDRDESSGTTVDLNYKLHVPPSWWSDAPLHPTYADTMQALHGANVWEDARLQRQIDALGIKGEAEPYGSPLDTRTLQMMINMTNPTLFLEVGVFRGATSMRVARMFEKQKRFKNSFVISMDTWLLDLRFVWGAKQRAKHGAYFGNVQPAGSSQMYFSFLANVLSAKVSHRIIPLQTASANGAMALIAKKLRPDLMYIDASHSNPDVFIDYENLFTILRPGGVMAVDDVDLVPAVRQSFQALCKRYNLKATYKPGDRKNQAWVLKPLHFD